MNDPYLYPQTGILKNLAGIQNPEELSQMEAEYTSLRLAELVMITLRVVLIFLPFVICITIFFKIFMNGQEKLEL